MESGETDASTTISEAKSADTSDATTSLFKDEEKPPTTQTPSVCKVFSLLLVQAVVFACVACAYLRWVVTPPEEGLRYLHERHSWLHEQWREEYALTEKLHRENDRVHQANVRLHNDNRQVHEGNEKLHAYKHRLYTEKERLYQENKRLRAASDEVREQDMGMHMQHKLLRRDHEELEEEDVRLASESARLRKENHRLRTEGDRLHKEDERLHVEEHQLHHVLEELYDLLKRNGRISSSSLQKLAREIKLQQHEADRPQHSSESEGGGEVRHARDEGPDDRRKAGGSGDKNSWYWYHV